MTDAKLVDLSAYFERRAKANRSKIAPTAVEGLRLVQAFLRIDDPERRASVIEMVEQMSAPKSR